MIRKAAFISLTLLLSTGHSAIYCHPMARVVFAAARQSRRIIQPRRYNSTPASNRPHINQILEEQQNEFKKLNSLIRKGKVKVALFSGVGGILAYEYANYMGARTFAEKKYQELLQKIEALGLPLPPRLKKKPSAHLKTPTTHKEKKREQKKEPAKELDPGFRMKRRGANVTFHRELSQVISIALAAKKQGKLPAETANNIADEVTTLSTKFDELLYAITTEQKLHELEEQYFGQNGLCTQFAERIRQSIAKSEIREEKPTE